MFEAPPTTTATTTASPINPDYGLWIYCTWLAAQNADRPFARRFGGFEGYGGFRGSWTFLATNLLPFTTPECSQIMSDCCTG